MYHNDVMVFLHEGGAINNDNNIQLAVVGNGYMRPHNELLNALKSFEIHHS